ncbi:hypothetical protein KC365_g5148 [Hortaea werneckii]|nr:hypothetical protein KC365_g5148 [Hortaea werneckii]
MHTSSRADDMSEKDHQLFLEAGTHGFIVAFAFRLSDSVRDKMISGVAGSPAAEDAGVKALLGVLDEAKPPSNVVHPSTRCSASAIQPFVPFSTRSKKAFPLSSYSGGFQTTQPSMRGARVLPTCLEMVLVSTTAQGTSSTSSFSSARTILDLRMTSSTEEAAEDIPEAASARKQKVDPSILDAVEFIATKTFCPGETIFSELALIGIPLHLMTKQRNLTPAVFKSLTVIKNFSPKYKEQPT